MPLWSEALLFQHMKTEIDEMISLYGNENAPPPWQIFTIANNIREGNMHFVQKVFDGAFEVCRIPSILDDES